MCVEQIIVSKKGVEMEYTTEEIYWEDRKDWFKSKSNDLLHYLHNDEVSCWCLGKKLWSGSFDDKKKLVKDLVWKKVDTRFVRDCIKVNHSKEEWKSHSEYPYLSDGYDYGNQATKYVSALGKADRRRFTLILDDDVYEEVIEDAQSKGIRRNTYLNTIIREVYADKVAEVGAE